LARLDYCGGDRRSGSGMDGIRIAKLDLTEPFREIPKSNGE
jgi:hypothetical protein